MKLVASHDLVYKAEKMDDIDNVDQGIVTELTAFAQKVGVYVLFVAVLYFVARLLQSLYVFIVCYFIPIAPMGMK